METETKSLVFVSEDEGTASDPIDQKNSGATVEELEEEIRELEKTLKRERSERRRIQAAAQEEVEREVIKAEEIWMERARQAIQERDTLATKTQQMEEQLDSIRLDVNRAVAYRLEMEESRNRMKTQLELVQRDYEETMMERSTVLEENQRLAEEKDHLRRTIHSLNKTVEDLAHRANTGEVEDLKRKLEQSRRQMTEESALATRRQGEIVDQLTRLGEQLRLMTAERDEAQRRLQDTEEEREQIVDIWITHTVDMALPFPKPNLGIVLSGGRSDDRFAVHSPVYVKDVLSGSPLEQVVRKLDHILMVNDIDVTEMDQRSVIDILKNSHHLSLVIRRRANEHKIHEVSFANNHELGIELGNGVFVNTVEMGGTASRSGIIPGSRLVHVNHVPVYDAKHAEQMIKYTNGSLVLGVLDGKKRNEAKETKQRTIFSKLFGRHNTEKSRPVVAKATIVPEGSAFLRQGSLRIPASQPAQLVRYGSLRAPPGSMEGARFSEHLEHIINKSNSPRLGAHSDMASSAWPKTVPEEVVPRRRVHRPSVFPIFANSPATSRHSRQSVEVSSPSPWSPREANRPVMRRPSYERRAVTSPIHSHYSERLSCYSPALPQPPPYPGPRDESLSSLLSSTNSLPVPGPSTYHNYTNNSPSGTLLSESSDKVRRVHLSREGNEFGLGLENHNGGVVISNVQGRTSGIVRRGDRLLDVGGINMRSADKESAVKVLNQFGASQDEVAILVASSSPRWIQVQRKSIKLCGGNAIGILAEAPAGDLQEGDLILEIDGFNVRGATLEEATEALLESLSEMADLLIEDGGDRLNRLRLGADGDAVYVRVNVDRNSENKDELDIRAGEIVFVDKTVFMGQRGRWRAWKMDREGRQRENGIIPSASQMEAIEQKKKGKARAVLSRAIYERMEKVCSSKRRPIVLFGPLFAPFVQALLDDSTKFAQVVPECKALQPLEVERQLHCCELIEARRRDKLFDVISASSITNVSDQGLHCIVDLSPAAVQRIHQLRIYPILIRLKFKSAKQVKDMKEDFGGEKLSSKAAKELMDKAAATDHELEQLGLQATVIQINSQGQTRTVLKHVCQQICAHVDHEQKKTIWVAMNC